MIVPYCLILPRPAELKCSRGSSLTVAVEDCRDPCCDCSCKRASEWIAADDWTRQGWPQGLEESMGYRPEIQTVKVKPALGFWLRLSLTDCTPYIDHQHSTPLFSINPSELRAQLVVSVHPRGHFCGFVSVNTRAGLQDMHSWCGWSG